MWLLTTCIKQKAAKPNTKYSIIASLNASLLYVLILFNSLQLVGHAVKQYERPYTKIKVILMLLSISTHLQT